MVRSLAEGAGGELLIESTMGAGTRVRLRLPVAAGKHPVRNGPFACVEVKEPRVAALARSLLMSQGFRVGECDGEPDGVRLWVTDASSTTPEAVSRVIAGSEPPLVVVIGVVAGHTFPGAPQVLTRPHGEPISALRRVLTDAANAAWDGDRSSLKPPFRGARVD
jgi:hypothetical protein